MHEEREEGPTSAEVTEKQISIEEMPEIPQEEKLQEQNKKIEGSQARYNVRKKGEEVSNYLLITYIKAGGEEWKIRLIK
jgi:hypothetical protein